MSDKIHIRIRLKLLKRKAAEKYNIEEEKCHIGHLLYMGMLDSPDTINQIDAATNESETNKSVATRSAQLASAMCGFGLNVGDSVLIIGYNNLNLAIPFYACHFNGYPLCTVDPNTDDRDLVSLFHCVRPKIVFCPKAKEENIKEACSKNNLIGPIVYLDDKDNGLEHFIEKYKGTEFDFRPAEFDQSKTAAWYMLTSGTTGHPKVAIVPYDILLNSVDCWWTKYKRSTKVTMVIMVMATIQWISSLMFFVATPLTHFTRVQSSSTLTPSLLVSLINKYKPNVTAWTPHLLNQFLKVSENVCDLSSFKYIAIGGSAIEKPLLDKFRERCNAYLYLVYGMTELLVPVFDFVDETPFGSTGLPFTKFLYKIVGEEGKIVDKPFETGELWIKGDAFFKGYLNNPEETQLVLTEDGWLKTGDIFYRDEKNFFYFVERKRLLIKHTGLWVSPLQLEEVIRKHPDVSDVCVVGIPDVHAMEMPVAAIVKKNDNNIDPKEIFDLFRDAVPKIRQLHGGYFYLDSLPMTPTGKVHRAKLRDIAITTPLLRCNDLN